LDGRAHKKVCGELRDAGEASGSASQPSEIANQVDGKVEEDAEKLLAACEEENLSDVMRLLESGVDPNHACRDHEPPIFDRCIVGSPEVISVLLNKGANPNLVDKRGETALRIACRSGYFDRPSRQSFFDIAKALVLSNADVSAVDVGGMTALHLACKNGHIVALVQLLISRQVDLVRVDKQGKTALDYARAAGRDDILKLFKAEMDERELILFKSEMDERELERDVGQELPKTFENAESPKMTIAAQASSGVVAAGRVEHLELEVKALTEKLRQGQNQIAEQSQATLTEKTTVREQHHQELQKAHSALGEQKVSLEREYQKRRKRDLQQHESLRKEEAEKAKKALAKQKQELEQRLRQTQENSLLALQAAQKKHHKEWTELHTDFQWQQEEAKRARREEGEAIQAAIRLEAELHAASSLANVSAVEQVPGLGDAELRELKEAVRNEYTRRHQLTLEREREEMRKTMRAELEQERASQREEQEKERDKQREEREEAAQCAICLDHDKDTALNCGHRACASCASELANCHICRKLITTRTRLY
jgi:hypothetical protein